MRQLFFYIPEPFSLNTLLRKKLLKRHGYIEHKNLVQNEFEIYNNYNELYLHDHTNTYSIAKAMFRNQNYNTGKLRYFDNNLK